MFRFLYRHLYLLDEIVYLEVHIFRRRTRKKV
jgi:hypothetical protein